MRARALTLTGASATGLPLTSSTTPCTASFCFTETQSSVRMPATTAAGQTGTVWRNVWISPLGSAKPASSTRSRGASVLGSLRSVTLPLPFLSSVSGSLSATSCWPSALASPCWSSSISSSPPLSRCARGGVNENSS